MAPFLITRTDETVYTAEVSRADLESFLEATGLWEPAELAAMPDSELANKVLDAADKDFELRNELYTVGSTGSVDVTGCHLDIEPK